MFTAYGSIGVEIFGASHAEKIGVKLSGLPAGLTVDLAAVQAFVDRRKSGQNAWSTPRKEPDEIIFESGINDGVTDGKGIVASIKNTSLKSSDYSPYKNTPRPSHADYAAILKDGDKAELVGGGRFSGRMTAPICIAGAIAMQLLEKRGIKIGAYVSAIGGVKGDSYNDRAITYGDVTEARKKPLCVIGDKIGEMLEKIIEAKKDLDSVGGQIEGIIFNPPKALGDALFSGIEGRIACSLFAIPAVKAVEFGLGVGFAR